MCDVNDDATGRGSVDEGLSLQAYLTLSALERIRVRQSAVELISARAEQSPLGSVLPRVALLLAEADQTGFEFSPARSRLAS